MSVMFCSCSGGGDSAPTADDAAFIPGGSSYVAYTGRVAKDDSTARFDWSGVTATVRFRGTQLSMEYADTKSNFFNVWIDKAPSAVSDTVVTTEGCGTLVLASELPEGEHSVTLQKRTEGEQGMVTVKSFSTDGEFLEPEARKSRRIEFVGDSYTCGFGTEGKKGDLFETSTENCNLAYAAIIGRFFDAEIQTVCHSGRGLVRNYDDGDSPVMSDRYSQMFDEFSTDPYDASSAGFKADIVVVYLGTNDFSCGKYPAIENWCNGFAKLLASIRANYGEDVPVLCVASRVDRLLAYFVEEGVKRSGDPKVSWCAIGHDIHNEVSDLGSVDHPNYAGQRKVAFQMIPYISTLTGWDVPAKPVE